MASVRVAVYASALFVLGASSAAAQALPGTISAGAPVARALSQADAAVLRRHLDAMAAGGPLYDEMDSITAKQIESNPDFAFFLAGVGPAKFVRFRGIEANGVGLFDVDHADSGATWRMSVGSDGKLLSLSAEAQPKKNELRETPGGRGWPQPKPTVDDLTFGFGVFAFLERTDGATTGIGWRADCYRILAPPGKALKLSVHTSGFETRAFVTDNCKGYTSQAVAATSILKSDFDANFFMPATTTYAWIEGEASGRPYQVTLTELTPQQVAQWQEEVRLARLARQQAEAAREADRDAMFGAVAGGLVAGFTNTSPPLMNSDGSAPNMLDTPERREWRARAPQLRGPGTSRLHDCCERDSGAGKAGGGSAAANADRYSATAASRESAASTIRHRGARSPDVRRCRRLQRLQPLVGGCDHRGRRRQAEGVLRAGGARPASGPHAAACRRSTTGGCGGSA